MIIEHELQDVYDNLMLMSTDDNYDDIVKVLRHIRGIMESMKHTVVLHDTDGFFKLHDRKLTSREAMALDGFAGMIK